MMASRRISGVQRGIRSTGANPARAAAYQTSASCATPATTTATDRYIPCSAPSGAPAAASPRSASTSATTRIRFNSTGAAAATANRPVAFSTPDNSAQSEMNRI